MANAYGIVHQYGEPQSTFDTNLAASVLGQKQQQFDANQQKIDQTLAQMGLRASMIQNDSAREYLNDRVNQVIEQTRSLRTADIGSADSTRKILSTINTALDDKVIKHIGYGQTIQKFNASVQEAQENGTYADQNYNDAVKQAGLQEYMQGDVNSDLGSLSYTPYNDNQMGLIKKAKEMKAVMGESSIDVIDENGFKKTTTINNLTTAEWTQVFPRYIDPQMEAQMEIEGRAMFGWNQENVIRYGDQALDERMDPIKKKIEKNKSLLKTDGQYSEAEKKQLREDISTWTKDLEKLESQKLEQNYDMTTLGKNLVMNDLINSTAAIVGSEPSIELSYDKDAAEARKAAENSVLMGGMPDGFRLSPTTSSELGDVDEQTLLVEQNEINQAYTTSINNGFATLPDNLREEAQERVEQIREEFPKMSLEDARFRAFEEKAKQVNSTEALEAYDLAKRAKVKRAQTVEAESKAYKNQINEVFKKQSVYKSFIEKGLIDRTTITINGENIHSKDYLETKGVRSYEDYKKFIGTPEAKEFKSQVSGQLFLSDVNTGSIGGISSPGYALSEIEPVTRFSREDYHNFKSFLASTGEDMGLTDLLVFSDYGFGDATDQITRASTPKTKEIRKFEILNGERLTEEQIISRLGDASESMYMILNPDAKGTKAYKTLKKLLGTGNYQKLSAISAMAGNLIDTSFANDKAIREGFSRASVLEGLQSERKKQTIAINQPNKITVQPALSNTKASDEILSLQSLALSRDTQGDGFELDRTLPTTIRINPRDANQVIIEQMAVYEESEFDGDEVEVKRDKVAKTATVTLEEFTSQLPNVARSLDLSQTAGELNYMSEMEIEETSIAYPKGKNKESIQTYTDFLGDPRLVNIATRDNATSVLRNTVSSGKVPEEMVSDYMQGFGTAMDNSDKFSISYKRKKGKQYVNIYDKKSKSGDPLFSIDVSKKDPEQMMKIFNVTPQIFLTQYLQTIATDLAENGEITERFQDFWELVTKTM